MSRFHTQIAALPVLLAAGVAAILQLPAHLHPATGRADHRAEPAVVILVRHAEKEDAPADDPPLTAGGRARGAALAAALEDAGVTAIITTDFARTRETAAPLAARLGVTPRIVSARGVTGAAHIANTVAAIREQSGGVVLVVGHSNTVPRIITALGAAEMRDLCESDYDNLFTVYTNGTAARLVRSRYGAADMVESEQGVCVPVR